MVLTVVIRHIYFERQGTPRTPIQRTAVEVAIYQQSGRFASKPPNVTLW
ncbi:hypothetical protein [Microcoleus sp. AT9b-C5]